ncbi:HD-GYP domain-containing protein [Pseudomonas gingeri]|uniref:HD-GYP domain-containing protein n=1 Tax=Pseudomonas gingeri TaxID=117681 RepID=A0A7Y8BRZ8_9PSED|nr:HD-GYP domain-containing protein [Pseudomonas gingeri]NWB85699.1 HD-GYP domain-containing protein [Pseudomonas gingeri]
MLRQIQVSELRVGMYVQSFCGSWMDHPFWRSHFLLDDETDLQKIRASGLAALWIDTDKGLDVEVGEPAAPELEALAIPAQERPRNRPRIAMSDEVVHALNLCARTKAAVLSLFGDLRMGRAVHPEQISHLIAEISDSLMRHPDALISLARLKTSDEYTYMHSVAVCALMMSLAYRLNLPEGLVKEAGMAGILHEVGKMMVPAELLGKTSPLTEAEFDILRHHPEIGAKMILDTHHFSPRVVDVCLHHHERIDGSGYPHKLCGTQISLFSRMAAVCDSYDSVTSERHGKQAWTAAEAIRKMADWKGQFDEQIFHAFVRCIGIYPVGALVLLHSGRLGIVLEQHEHSLLTPRVKVFYSAKLRMPIAQSVIDLAVVSEQDSIVSLESVKKWGFKHLDELWSGISIGKQSIFSTA